MTDAELNAAMDAAVAKMREDMGRAHALQAKDPKLPFVSALVIAGDLGSAERKKALVESGELTFAQALNRTGSYGRFEVLYWGIEAGHTTPAAHFKELPELWRGSDPDDTDPRALALWKEAFAANGHRYIRDGRALPRGKRITVYRGQDADAPWGIAWSTDREVAAKYADGMATRQSGRGGVVLEGTVPRERVMAYLTGRNEAEVVTNPFWVTPKEA